MKVDEFLDWTWFWLKLTFWIVFCIVMLALMLQGVLDTLRPW